jgi:hypothetical protein
LTRAGRFDDTKRRLLLHYFVRHLIKVADMPGNDSRRLAQAMLAFMRELAWTGGRRTAMTALWSVSRTPLLKPALHQYVQRTSWEFRFQSLRNVVQRFTPQEPPDALREILQGVPAPNVAVAGWNSRP